MSLAVIETLLQPDKSPFVIFPVKHNDVWDLCKKSFDCFQKAEDTDLSRDYVDWLIIYPVYVFPTNIFHAMNHYT